MSSDNPSAEPPRAGPRTVTYRQQPQGGSRWLMGCLAVVVGGIALVVLLCVVAVVGFFFMLVSSAQFAAEAGPQSAIHEVTVSGRGAAAKVAVIPVSGILSPGISGSPEPLFKAMLQKARKDESVKAVILVIDSGGGGITTSDVMYKDLLDFRNARPHKPVVVLMGDITASGAYYVSCAADYLMAHPTTITGSIGVMMPLFSINDLMKKVGVNNETIATGPYKEIGSPWGRTPEQWQKDKALLSGIMEQMYDRFVGVVAKGRGLDKATVRKLADGRVYSAQQALDNKLIDGIGYMSDAEAQVKKMTGLSAIHVVEYARMPSLRDLLFGATGRKELTVKLDASSVTGAESPAGDMRQPMYYWQP